jgi:hypothetical protein
MKTESIEEIAKKLGKNERVFEKSNILITLLLKLFRKK